MIAKRALAASAVAFLATVFLVACEEEVVPEKTVVRPVRAMKVNDTAAFQRRIFAGRAKATRELDLAFNVAGPLVEFPVKVGDQVEEGKLLARLDPATFQAEANRAAATLKRAKATSNNAKLQMDRDRILVKQGHVSQARLDRTMAKFDEADADVGAAESVLRRMQLDVKYTYLRAPFTGIVVQTFVDNFENVRAKEPVVRLVDASRIEMVIDIPENLITLVPQAVNIVVTFDAFPGTEIDATVAEIGTEASDITRTYPVTLIMDQPSGARILPGMAGKARNRAPIAVAQSGKGLEIPVSALLTDAASGNTYVWVIDEQSNTVTKRAVAAGALTDLGITITDGLTPGEWIATAGAHYLKGGQVVRIIEQ